MEVKGKTLQRAVKEVLRAIQENPGTSPRKQVEGAFAKAFGYRSYNALLASADKTAETLGLSGQEGNIQLSFVRQTGKDQLEEFGGFGPYQSVRLVNGELVAGNANEQVGIASLVDGLWQVGGKGYFRAVLKQVIEAPGRDGKTARELTLPEEPPREPVAIPHHDAAPAPWGKKVSVSKARRLAAVTEALTQVLELLGIEADSLDMMVYDTIDRCGSSTPGSHINNEGVEAQLRYLLSSGWDALELFAAAAEEGGCRSLVSRSPLDALEKLGVSSSGSSPAIGATVRSLDAGTQGMIGIVIDYDETAGMAALVYPNA